ncbi:OprD family outer membrane porin [Hydrogenimonas sp.]
MRSFFSTGFFLTAIISSAVQASGTSEHVYHAKRTLNSNRTLTYNVLPSDAKSLGELFEKGVWYGRLRMHALFYDWKEEIEGKTKDNWATGVGGSLTFKTAYLRGLGATIDAYTSQNPWHMDKNDIRFLKSGKDLLSRKDVYLDGNYCINVIAQLYAEYRLGNTSLKYGRQKFESLLAKSNDSKMIPNTFKGISITSHDLPKHTLKLAWFTRQKLRSHANFHDPLTYADCSLSNLTDKERLIHIWSNNDDSAMHKGLSYDNYKKSGKKTHHDLLIAEIWSSSTPNLKAMLNYTAVPGVLSSATVEAHYKFTAGTWKIAPGLRYLHQLDNGGGKVGGAALVGLLSPWHTTTSGQDGGYRNPHSLDGWLLAARIDLQRDTPYRVRLGYSHTGDKADIVAPWRGFPTGGFTRAMGQYNWFANTDTWMIRGDYDLNGVGSAEDITAMFRFVVEDFDETKKIYDTAKAKWIPLAPSDRKILELGAIWKISQIPGLEARIRMGFVDADKNLDGSDPSYSEYRLEMNYLF